MGSASTTGPALLAQIEAGVAPAVLDVRSRWEFRRGHVPGAVRMPYWAVFKRASEIASGPGGPVVVYCEMGPRAWIAGVALRARGFRQVGYLAGHMFKWRWCGLRQKRGL